MTSQTIEMCEADEGAGWMSLRLVCCCEELFAWTNAPHGGDIGGGWGPAKTDIKRG